MAEKPKPDVPKPCSKEVKKYLRKWNKSKEYISQEGVLYKLFKGRFPNNTDTSEILLKVAALNQFYSTNIYSVYPVAKRILRLHIDDRLKKGDVSLVADIQKVTIKGKVINFYSFATKYCSHHNPGAYPIYDSYVEKVLCHFRDLDNFSSFKNVELRDYAKFKEIVEDFISFYHLSPNDKYSFKDIDKYIWQLGKKYFTKSY